MAWTTPGTVAPGEVYTSSRYNTDTVGNLNYLYTPPMVRLTKSADQSAATDTLVTWNTETYDTDSMHNTSTNTSRITFTTAGIYRINGLIISTGNASALGYMLLGGTTRLAFYHSVAVAGGLQNSLQINHTGSFTAGQYMEIYVNLGAGASIDATSTDFGTTYLAADWIGNT